MRSNGIAESLTGGVYNYENDISAKETPESKGSRFQSKNGKQIRKKGPCCKTRKGQKGSYNFG